MEGAVLSAEFVIQGTLKQPVISSTASCTPLDIPHHVTILHVYNTAATTSSDTLQKFFENRHRSGGGKVKNVKRDEEHGCWIVIFTDEEGKLILS